MTLLEVCANGLESALNAQTGGADRVELCDNLWEGGTTPSPATLLLATKKLQIPVFALLRPRGGDFLYSDLELEVLKTDLDFCKKNGVSGIVVGILNADGTVDETRTSQLVERAYPLAVTFHRAFDLTPDPVQALEAVIRTGATTVLTSGQATPALNGLHTLQQLVRQANGRISIMAGSGVNPQNVTHFLKIGVQAVHLSGLTTTPSKMTFQPTTVPISTSPDIPNFDKRITDPAIIRNVRAILNQQQKM